MEKQENLIQSWLGLTRFHSQFSRKLEQSLQEKHGLALNEFYVLLFIMDTESKYLKLQELQNLIGLSQSAMSRLASRMESKSCGVIKRQGLGEDSRDVYASLTGKGEEFFKEVYPTFQETVKDFFTESRIDPEQFLKIKNRR